MGEAAAAGARAGRGKGGLLIGLAAALVLGGAAFYATWSGMVDPLALVAHDEAPEAAAAPAFVALPPIMISLPRGGSARRLRFAGQIEVETGREAEVAALEPRILDTLNTYLRAVEVRDLENPAALQRLRAQMLRRVRVVAGEERVRDLLVAEFVLD